MDAEFKAKWIAALRSGDYKQGRGWLNKDGKLCCLGVACEVAGIAAEPAPDMPKGVFAYEGRIGGPPITLGVDDDEVIHLVCMNDTEGKTFAEIADYIEANL